MLKQMTISKGNKKMGDIESISLPAITTCRADCPCYKDCYAARMAAYRKTVRDSYERNYQTLKEDPKMFWTVIKAAMMVNKYFRFHVSGDIVDADYFDHMVKLAREVKTCEVMCFTKKYEIVNNYLDKGKRLPKNLHIMFSVWPGLKCDNPHHLPEAHVLMKDGSCTCDPAKADYHCKKNCMECAVTNSGCWSLKRNQKLVLDFH